MKEYTIIEIDLDYGTKTDEFEYEAASKEEAEQYCKDKSWTGFHYFVKS